MGWTYGRGGGWANETKEAMKVEIELSELEVLRAQARSYKQEVEECQRQLEKLDEAGIARRVRIEARDMFEAFVRRLAAELGMEAGPWVDGIEILEDEIGDGLRHGQKISVRFGAVVTKDCQRLLLDFGVVTKKP